MHPLRKMKTERIRDEIYKTKKRLKKYRNRLAWLNSQESMLGIYTEKGEPEEALQKLIAKAEKEIKAKEQELKSELAKDIKYGG